MLLGLALLQYFLVKFLSDRRIVDSMKQTLWTIPIVSISLGLRKENRGIWNIYRRGTVVQRTPSHLPGQILSFSH